MKKLVALLLSIMIVFVGATPAFAEELDLSQFSDDQIVSLLVDVQNELVSRNIEKTATLAAGTYIAGRDIPVGSYMLKCHYDKDSGGANFRIQDADGNKKMTDTVFSGNNSGASQKIDGSWYISLEENDELVITYEMKLTISSGVKFE